MADGFDTRASRTDHDANRNPAADAGPSWGPPPARAVPTPPQPPRLSRSTRPSLPEVPPSATSATSDLLVEPSPPAPPTSIPLPP